MTADDVELGQRFRAGDRAAFAQISAPHLDALYTLALRMTGNEAEATDLAQDALVRALEQRARFDATRPFRPWLLTLAANLCRDRLRSVWWRRVVALVDVPPAPIDAADDRLAEEEGDAAVRRALSTLAVHYREAVALYYLEDMTYAEMVLITGVSEAALKQRVRRGLEMLEAAYRRLYPNQTALRSLERAP